MKNSPSTQRENRSEPTRLSGASDPYDLLALYIFNQAVMDITAFYSESGTLEARQSGRDAIRWIRRCEGNFTDIAKVVSDIRTDLSIETFHQWCLELIYDIQERSKHKSRVRIIKSLTSKRVRKQLHVL